MTEPLNITIDRLSEEYDTLRKRCENAEQPREKDTGSLLAIINAFRTMGITVETPEYCRPKTATFGRMPETYRIPDVPYRGENSTVYITRELLDGGARRTQDEWLDEYVLGTIGHIGIPDTELYFTLIDTLDKNKKHLDVQQRQLIGHVRDVIREDFRDYCMMTSTRAYSDKTVHQYQTPQSITRNSIKGINGYLTQLADGDAIAKILGNTTAARLDDILGNITDRRTCVWRPEEYSNPLLLGVSGNGRFDIIAYGSIGYDRPARGMAVHKQ
ncbi:TPA: hypothetical protein HA251_02025 [Candidatus Woesearchaeota archaeon]|nr:hypothetical protein [Candidatus Woesearchaeota archaeon]